MLGLGGIAATAPLTAHDPRAGPLRRIAVLLPQMKNDRTARNWVKAFRQRLRELGWTEPNLAIEYRWYGGNLDRIRVDAAELVRLEPDVIICMATPALRALKRATRRIPIVFMNANYPVESRFVASLAQPGGNITGFVSFERSMGGKWLEILHEIAPGIARVGLVYNPRTHSGHYFAILEAAAQSLGVEPVRLPFADLPELRRRVMRIAGKSGSGLIVLPDPSTGLHREAIVRLAARHRLPAVYAYQQAIADGGLAYYGVDTTEQFRKAATYVDHILRGARPADLPVQAPTKFELVINLRAARALGLSVPRSILMRADEVIE